jgi:ApbE superfamily uncharacterized protein (UPF0280 family)
VQSAPLSEVALRWQSALFVQKSCVVNFLNLGKVFVRGVCCTSAAAGSGHSIDVGDAAAADEQ